MKKNNLKIQYTKEQKIQIEAEARWRERRNKSFSEMLPIMTPSYQWDLPHLKYMRKPLEDITPDNPKYVMQFVPAQHGKKLSDDTPILTSKGWSRHGKLKVGDFIYGRFGEKVKVLNIFNNGCDVDCLVEFSDGEKIKCHENHEWFIFDSLKKKWKILETKEILNEGLYRENGSRNRFFVEPNNLVEFKEKKLLIHPYIFGAWLGNGTTSKGCITNNPKDIQIIEKIEKLGMSISNIWINKKSKVPTFNLKELRLKLIEIGFINGKFGCCKFIPDDYKFSSKEQRLELLAGLIDTDGYVYRKNGRIVFTNSNKEIIDGVRDIIVSLGFRATICSFQPKTSSSGIHGKKIIYQLGFNADIDIPTAVPRKKIILMKSKKKKRGIKNITKIESQSGKCITVEGGIYLAGKNLIPTHNSSQNTVNFAAYYLLKYPNQRIGIFSYNEDLATRFSREIRRIVNSKMIIKKGALNKAGYWETGHGGSLRSVGIRGSIAGFPFDLIIVDDAIRNAIEAYSNTIRETIWGMWTGSIISRVHNKTSMIFTITRWHHDDLAGRLLKLQPGKWEVIRLPGIAEKDDPLGRKEGEALWAERFSKELLMERSGLSKIMFEAVVQQRPSLQEGNIIKSEWWLRFNEEEFNKLRSQMKIVMSWDTAYKKGLDNDFSVCMIAGKIGNKFYFLEMSRKRLTFPELKREFERLSDKWKPRVIYIEDKVSGTSLVQELQTISKYKSLIKPVKPTGEKEARAHAVTPTIEAGNCFLPDADKWSERCDVNNKWVDAFISECSSFPNGEHDDIVDATQMILNEERIVWQPRITWF